MPVTDEDIRNALQKIEFHFSERIVNLPSGGQAIFFESGCGVSNGYLDNSGHDVLRFTIYQRSNIFLKIFIRNFRVLPGRDAPKIFEILMRMNHVNRNSKFVKVTYDQTDGEVTPEIDIPILEGKFGEATLMTLIKILSDFAGEEAPELDKLR